MIDHNPVPAILVQDIIDNQDLGRATNLVAYVRKNLLTSARETGLSNIAVERLISSTLERLTRGVRENAPKDRRFLFWVNDRLLRREILEGRIAA